MRDRQPEIKRRADGYSFQVDGRPFIALAGEVHNSACTSEEYMQEVWRRAEDLHCNTILAPVYWEHLEPREGQYNDAIVRRLLDGAREYQMRLILLWFGAWKNGLSTYAPEWIKTDIARFPRTEDSNGVKTRILSMFDTDLLAVELQAFEHLMRYLCEMDGDQHTVIAVQVENEVGVLGASRDYSQAAEAIYQHGLPDKSIALTDERFMCWQYAAHMNTLAKSGKEIYALPMYTNVWLKEYPTEEPGSYPSGGPEPDMIDIWKAVAPDLDILAPDLYTFQFDRIASTYKRDDNPLFIPETRRDKWAVAHLYAAIGAYQTLCYSPFGIESVGEDHSYITGLVHTNIADTNVSSTMVKEYLSLSYHLLGNMMPLITECYGTNRMIGFCQDGIHAENYFRLGDYYIKVEFYHSMNEQNEYIPGAGIIMMNDDQELTFVGYGFRANVESMHRGQQLDFLSLERGVYDADAVWVKEMDLNGDEQYIRMNETPSVLRARYYWF